MLSIDVGGSGVSLDLRQWVNSGLMTSFFLVVGSSAARVRPGRVAGASAAGPAAAGGDRGHGDGGCHLPRLQRGPLVGRRVGIACRPIRPSLSACSRSSGRASRPPACVMHRRVVDASSRSSSSRPSTRRGCASCRARGRRLLRRPRRRACLSIRAGPCGGAGGRRLVGCSSQEWSRRDRLATGLLTTPSGSAVQSRARDRAVPRVPRAAHRRLARVAGAELRSATSLNERLPAAVPPVDELRDRAAVRALRTRESRSTAPFSRGLELSDHARDLVGYVSESRSASSAAPGS